MKSSGTAALWGVSVLTLALLSCGSDSTLDSATAAPSVDGPVLRHGLPFATEGEDAEVKGVVEVDGDCLYLVWSEVGQRVPVVWPASTSWDAEAGVVLLPNGESVGDGDSVYGGGGYRHVEGVRRIAGDAVADRADQCVDSYTRDVAVVNNQPDAISRDR